MSNHDRLKIIIITGATATGKSSLAVTLAAEYDGEIINCDSMQVYRGMDIGTAKPAMDERKGIAHHMLNVVDPSEEFNASLYRQMTVPLIRDINKRGRTCFIVGGTGLYIKTLLGGLIDCPPVSPMVRDSIKTELEEYGAPFLYERLRTLDHDYAQKIHPNDTIRIIRALEIIEATGRPLSNLILEHSFREKIFDSLKICLFLNRDDLYTKINYRSAAMFRSGLIDEAMNLLKSGYSEDLKPMKSIGYRHALDYINKMRNYEESVDLLQRDTRRYAKRQITWFRSDPDMFRVHPEEINKIKREIEKFI